MAQQSTSAGSTTSSLSAGRGGRVNCTLRDRTAPSSIHLIHPSEIFPLNVKRLSTGLVLALLACGVGLHSSPVSAQDYTVKVRLKTTAGDIVLALDRAKAPKTVDT